MAQQWTWGTVSETLAGGWQEFIRLCNRRMRDLEVLLKGVVSVATGSGTTNALPKWTGAQTLGDSSITDTGSLVSTANPVAIGANAASIGALRLGNGIPNGIWFRNAANTSDVEGVEFDNTDTLRLLGAWYISQTGGLLYPSATGVTDIGSTSKRVKDIHLSGDAHIKALTYTWPSSHASGVLTNNGSGTLSWAASGGSGSGGMNALQAAGF